MRRQSDKSAPPFNPEIQFGFEEAVRFVRAVCCLAGDTSFVQDTREYDLQPAIARRDTAAVFNWLVQVLSFQGVANALAADYLARHGSPTWAELSAHFAAGPLCPKLRSFVEFKGCRYDKTSHTCAEPDHFDGCSLPRHVLRNGRLNQMTYSLYLFVRDVAGGDLVGWIEAQIGTGSEPTSPETAALALERLVGPLRAVYGVADKVLLMALSSILIGSPNPAWAKLGASTVVVDTLVHNFLHRTGLLRRFQAEHAYGASCYRQGGCADVIRTLASKIDAREFNRSFPAYFPRFVQLAIWRYCSQDGLGVCNGRRIDDRRQCQNSHCQLYGRCDRLPLRKTESNQVDTLV